MIAMILAIRQNPSFMRQACDHLPFVLKPVVGIVKRIACERHALGTLVPLHLTLVLVGFKFRWTSTGLGKDHRPATAARQECKEHDDTKKQQAEGKLIVIISAHDALLVTTVNGTA